MGSLFWSRRAAGRLFCGTDVRGDIGAAFDAIATPLVASPAWSVKERYSGVASAVSAADVERAARLANIGIGATGDDGMAKLVSYLQRMVFFLDHVQTVSGIKNVAPLYSPIAEKREDPPPTREDVVGNLQSGVTSMQLFSLAGRSQDRYYVVPRVIDRSKPQAQHE